MTGRAPARRTPQDRQRRAELATAAAGMTLSVYRLDPGTGARHTVVAEHRVEGPPLGRHCLAEPSVYPRCRCGRTPDCDPDDGGQW